MPQFIDHHEMSDVAPELTEGIAQKIKAGQPDENGVTGLNVYLAKDGTAYCVSDAPDAEAVMKAHEAVGFSLSRSDVVEVRSVV
jgi:hypothetical protein